MKAHLLKTLCLTFSLLLTHSLLNANTSAAGAYGGPILRSNWQNGMSFGPYSNDENCINTGYPPSINIILTATFGSSDIEAFGPMYLYFELGLSQPFTASVLITENLLVPTVIDNETFYVFSTPVNVPMAAECLGTGPDQFALAVRYGLYNNSNGTGPAIPAYALPLIFPQDSYSDFDNDPFFHVEYSGIKTFCCEKPETDSQEEEYVEAENIRINTTSLSETKTGISEEEVNVFPNPFNDQIELRLDGNAVMFRELMITDWTGRVVFFRENANPIKTEIFNLEIDTQDLPNGVYWLHIRTEEEVKNIPLVKS